jgi:hypothetical protein
MTMNQSRERRIRSPPSSIHLSIQASQASARRGSRSRAAGAQACVATVVEQRKPLAQMGDSEPSDVRGILSIPSSGRIPL